jgi:hypothetical protein
MDVTKTNSRNHVEIRVVTPATSRLTRSDLVEFLAAMERHGMGFGETEIQCNMTRPGEPYFQLVATKIVEQGRP